MPMVQDVPLARALYASCEIGQEIPAELFTAVARVLAFVMRLGARGVKGGFHRPGFEPPAIDGSAQGGTTPGSRIGRNVPAQRASSGDCAHVFTGTGGAPGCR